jgi:hypothetical protein
MHTCETVNHCWCIPQTHAEYLDVTRLRRFLFGTAVVAMVTFLACVGALQLVRHNVRVSYSYCLEARFNTLPADDKALKAWVLAQPGVVASTVHLGRAVDDKNLLVIGFMQVQTIALVPPIPDFDTACKQFGYANQDAPFRDSEDRNRRIVEEP